MPGNPITTVVIFFMENHTTDNVASEIAGVDGMPALPLAPDVVVPDISHDHGHWMVRDTSDLPARQRRYQPAQIPNLSSLMSAFTICDRYFSDFAGNSFPNHCFAIGADAEWADANPSSRHPLTVKVPGVPVRLTAAGKTWANYGHGFAFAQYSDPAMHANVKTSAAFLADAQAGQLPDVSWVYAPAGKIGDTTVGDFHPGPLGHGSSMKASDHWLSTAVAALAKGPHWGSVMAFITFDDWGGWADHVVPPVKEVFPQGTPFAGDPYRYGSRVPCVVVGPYAKPQHASHQENSHASLVAYIERLWQLAPSPSADAKARTAASNAMSDCHDYTQAPLQPPKLPG